MNLLDLMVKIGVEDNATSGVGKIASKVTSALGTAAKAATAAVTAAAGGIGAFTKASLDAYAAYEQNVGGVQKLFGNMGKGLEEYAQMTGQSVDQVADKWQALENAQNTVLSNAKQAWKTAGMSANQYMEQATSFSAALITSMGNDTEAAAARANMAMVDMSDNANTFGTDMRSIQWAYQGFAKQNYTMLDNLKLGYGGTKEEMERLIADANKVKQANGEMAELSIDSFADVVEAIHIIQGEMQISGTTAREAATTIEGSVNMMKAAWENWLTGLGDSDADMGQLTDNLVESFETAAENVVPRVSVIFGTILGEIPELAAQLGPVAAQAVGDTLQTAWSTLHDMLPEDVQEALNAARQAFESSGLAQAGESLFDSIGDAAEKLGETAGGAADALGDGGLEGALSVAAGLVQAFADAVGWVTENADVLLPIVSGLAGAFAALSIIETVAGFVTFLVTTFGPLVSVAGMVVSSIAAGAPVFGTLATAIGLVASPVTVAVAAIGVLIAIVVALATNAGGCRDKVVAAFNAVASFIGSLPGSVGGFLSDVIAKVGAWAGEMASGARQAASEFASNLLNRLAELPGQALSAGQSIVQGLIDGITGMIGAAGSAIGSVVDAIASYLPHSPAKRGPFSGKGWTPYSGRAIVHGLAEGIAELADEPADAMASVMEGISATQAVADAATVTVKGSGGMTEGESAVIAWLAENLPAIISEFTPVMGESEFGRKARKAVAYA